MEEIKYSIRTLAVMLGWTYAEMAEHTGIKARRLMDLNAGLTKMTAEELWLIADATGVPARQIELKG